MQADQQADRHTSINKKIKGTEKRMGLEDQGGKYQAENIHLGINQSRSGYNYTVSVYMLPNQIH